jgi:hypothetical protein
MYTWYIDRKLVLMVLYGRIRAYTTMNRANLEELQEKFPRLSMTNQQYILGITEGLKHAQDSLGKPAGNKAGPAGKRRGEGRRTVFP